jgi:hypothetical protein
MILFPGARRIKERMGIIPAFESIGGKAVSGFEWWVEISREHAEGARG